MTQSLLLTALGVAVAGGLGSVLRYALDVRWPARAAGGAVRRQPLGQWIANVGGSLLIGLAGGLSSELWHAVLAAGAAGGLTTWSSWAVGASARWQAGRERGDRTEQQAALLQSAGQLVCGVAAAGIGVAAAALARGA
ncbi:fluoride efflux transporter FluC [Arthrobacter sp. UM1]|uniref:fluoride efflux transporter FluC n=1 Tax=Arthrobacter sp. UM1 TaxID=2766776 RepID=UPI001CF64A94|nr:CrcB family protein [Arthrobacter sp. UM1]MCB4207186.1 CrcB family protein [Arthrobacter sp. UM1]